MFYYKQSYSKNMKILIFIIVGREDEFLVNRNTGHLKLAGRWHTAGVSSAQSGILHCVLQIRKFEKNRAQWRMTKTWDWMKRKISVSERIDITAQFKTKLNMVKLASFLVGECKVDGELSSPNPSYRQYTYQWWKHTDILPEPSCFRFYSQKP